MKVVSQSRSFVTITLQRDDYLQKKFVLDMLVYEPTCSYFWMKMGLTEGTACTSMATVYGGNQPEAHMVG